VAEIDFDPETYLAVVTMKLDKRYKFPSDTFVTINTSGLLGEQYIGMEVGGDSLMLKDGDIVKKTSQPWLLEKLISQFMFSKAAEDGNAKK